MFSNKGTVVANFTIGFGNNLFQYCYARLLAEKNELQLHHKGIEALNISPSYVEIDQSLPTIIINDENYKKMFFLNSLGNCNIIVNGYFEDYKIYKPYLSEIRSWFPKTTITNKKDVIIHLRLQNRLIQVSHNKNHITTGAFKAALANFDYDNVHVVTDAEKWDYYNEQDIQKIRDEIAIGPNPPTNSPWVPVERSLEYMNSLVDGFKDLNPIVHCNDARTIKGSGGLRDNFIDDFNLLKSFDKVIIFNSTFSWWAATISGASEVGIYNPWKIAKEPKDRKNLGKTNFPGWFSWGSYDDLHFKDYEVEKQ